MTQGEPWSKVDADGWPVGHLCMEPHPDEPDVFCRKLAGHLGRGEKHAPAMSDFARRRGEPMPSPPRRPFHA